MAESLEWWYEYHREDYAAVKERLTWCRNVMLRGRLESASRMLRLSCVNAVLSIQTPRERHERAFTAYCAANTSVEQAAGMTLYGNQKAEWLHHSFATFDFEECVSILRQDSEKSVDNALQYIVDNFKGLSYVKAGFALAMCGVWELACPDTRCRQFLDIDDRIRTATDYVQACQMIDDSLDCEEPRFIKQWAMYDYQEQEHARHMPFFVEALPALR